MVLMNTKKGARLRCPPRQEVGFDGSSNDEVKQP